MASHQIVQTKNSNTTEQPDMTIPEQPEQGLDLSGEFIHIGDSRIRKIDLALLGLTINFALRLTE